MSSLRFDRDYQRAAAPFAGVPSPRAYDAGLLRRISDTALGAMMSFFSAPGTNDVTETTLQYTAGDGTPLTLHRFTPPAGGDQTDEDRDGRRPAVLYIHGGGHVSGSVGLFRKDVMRYAAASGRVFFAPAYRLAPEHPFPAALEDAYAALRWLGERADEQGVDAGRIAVMGISSGGGVAAAVALMARERRLSPPIARLVLVYPMLDDRTTAVAEGDARAELLTWDARHNEIGWRAYLGKTAAPGEDRVPPWAAPAREQDLSGLPRTYIDVGGLDLFRDESLAFGARLAAANVEVELHLYPGVPHAWEWVAASAPVTKRAVENRVRALRDL